MANDDVLTAMAKAPGKPQATQSQPPKPTLPDQRQPSGEMPDIYHDARAMAKAIDDIAQDAQLAAQSFQLESQRLADEYRRLVDAFMTRLIGPRGR